VVVEGIEVLQFPASNRRILSCKEAKTALDALALRDTMRELKGLTGLPSCDPGIGARKHQNGCHVVNYFIADSLNACLSETGRDLVRIADPIGECEVETCMYRPMFGQL